MNYLIKKSVEELKKMEEESRAELFALRFQSAIGNLEKPHRIKKLKKQIAHILTILSTRKNAGENISINVKVNLNETYAKIEKESQIFVKQRKMKIEQIMAEQQAVKEETTNLMDLPLNDTTSPTKEQVVDLTTIKKESAIDKQKTLLIEKKTMNVKDYPKEKCVVEEKNATKKMVVAPLKKAPMVKKNIVQETKTNNGKDTTLKTLIKEKVTENKSTVKNKITTLSENTTATVKLNTYAKSDIEEIPNITKKVKPIKTIQKVDELKTKEKLASTKSPVAIDGIAKGRELGIKIDLELKTKDPNAKEYIYGTNWKENRDKFLTVGKTKEVNNKITKKRTGKK